MSLDRLFGIVLLLLLLVSPLFGAGVEANEPLAEGLRPFLKALGGKESQFLLTGNVALPIDGKEQTVAIQLVLFSDEDFDLSLSHREYAVSIRRRAETTAFALPLHKVVFIGHGQIDSADSLKPLEITTRLLSPGSQAGAFAPLVLQADANAVSVALTTLAGVTFNLESERWSKGDISFAFASQGTINILAGDASIDLALTSTVPEIL